MSQFSLFGDSGADPAPKPKALKAKPSPKAAAKRIDSAVIRKIEIQPVEPGPKPTSNSAKWGYCRICGMEIAIPGLDSSLCSNPDLSCGSSGWVVDPQWLAANPPRSGKGGAA